MGILVINGLFFSYMIVHVTPFFCALSGNYKVTNSIIRSSHLEVFLGKGVLKICNKFTGEHPCRSVISINLLCNFTKIALRRGCSLANLLHIFRTPFLDNTSGWLLLNNLFWNEISSIQGWRLLDVYVCLMQ